MFGKNPGKVSKHWKKTGNIFQSLEKKSAFFPNIGKMGR
jgi:hypothetical protein